MSEPVAPAAAEGQAPLAPTQGQATEAPEAAKGQAAESRTSPATPEVETFYDSREIPEGLQGHYKSMQAAFTKKMQGLSMKERASQEKLQAYDDFLKDPISSMQTIASRYGYRLSRAEAAEAVRQQERQTGYRFSGEDGAPASWDEVVAVTKAQTREEILRELSPYLTQVKSQSAAMIEKQFDAFDVEFGLPSGSWRNNEGPMSQILQKHPTLANDPETLYRLSLPEEVVVSKATQRALAKMDNKVKSAQIGTRSSTKQAVSTGKEIKSFNDAYEAAKAALASSN